MLSERVLAYLKTPSGSSVDSRNANGSETSYAISPAIEAMYVALPGLQAAIAYLKPYNVFNMNKNNV